MKVVNVTVHQHQSKNSCWWCNWKTNEKQCRIQWHNSEHRQSTCRMEQSSIVNNIMMM